MTLTINEEEILKAIVVQSKANQKLNDANLIMGNEIRAEFKIIDDRIRAENKEAIGILQTNLNIAIDDLKVKLE